MNRKAKTPASFTQTDRFIFCDLCRKAVGKLDFANAKPAPSVNFETTGQKTPVIRGRETAKAHHDTEHKRDGVV